MDTGRIAVRAIFAFVFLLVLMRLSGKHFVRQATGFDFVLALIIGDMIDDLLWAEVPASQFVVACGALAITRMLVAIADSTSPLLHDVLAGKERIIVRDGSFLHPPARLERMNEKEVEEQLRTHGLDRQRWNEVKSAWVEPEGRVSVLRKDWAREAQKEDLPRLRRRSSSRAAGGTGSRGGRGSAGAGGGESER